MDWYQLGEDLAALTFSLIPLLVVAAAVAVTWWAIARARREKAEREQRNEPAYPHVSSHSMGVGQPSSVDPNGTAEYLADPPRNELGSDQQHPASRMEAPPVGYPIPMPPTPPARKRPAAKLVLIVVAGVVVVLAGGWAIIAASRNTTTPATHAAATAATTAATPTVPPSTAAATTPTASPTPAPTTAAPPTTFKTVTAWYHSGGMALIDAIRDDNSAIRNTNQDSTDLRHTCQKLASDAQAANNYAPIPDNQAQPHWAKSLPLIIQGAWDCAGAIDGTGDVTMMTAVGEMNDGFDELNLVVARLNTLHA